MNHRNRRRAGWVRDGLILTAALALMIAAGWGFSIMVERGRPRRAAFSREMERALADAVEASIRTGRDIVEEPAVTEAIGAMQERLEQGLGALELPGDAPPEFRVLVVDSPSVNALAFPGRLVVLYTGLIQAMDGPEELAGVLAHEISHCVYNDSRNALIREVGVSVLVGASGAGSAGELAGEVIRGAVRMRYGRRAEERADRFAVELLAASNIDPRAYERALGALQDAAGEEPEWARYVDVHPPLDDRRALAAERAESSGSPGKGYPPVKVDWAAVLAALPSDLSVPEN